MPPLWPLLLQKGWVVESPNIVQRLLSINVLKNTIDAKGGVRLVSHGLGTLEMTFLHTFLGHTLEDGASAGLELILFTCRQQPSLTGGLRRLVVEHQAHSSSIPECQHSLQLPIFTGGNKVLQIYQPEQHTGAEGSQTDLQGYDHRGGSGKEA